MPNPDNYQQSSVSLKGGLSDLSSGFGVYSGIEKGGAYGDATAAVSAAKLGAGLGGQTGALSSSGASSLNTYAGEGANILGIYSGLQRGGFVGDTSAAVNAAQLGSTLGAFGGASSTVGAVAGYAAIPLALYNEVSTWQSGKAGSDALSGAETGAAIGSVIPVVGTAVGAVVGGAVGALSSLFGPGAKDPETTDVQSLINYTSSHGNSQAAASTVQNPYLQLAGLFDERSSTLPMYQQYGRMGEQKFTNDMVSQINQAAAQGKISQSSTPQQVYQTVVAPWVASMGSGWGNVGATYTATTQGLLQDMVTQYMSGQATQDWKAVGGDEPFKGLAAYGSQGWGSTAPASGNTATPVPTATPRQAYQARNMAYNPAATAATGVPQTSNFSFPTAAAGLAGGLAMANFGTNTQVAPNTMTAGGPGGDPNAAGATNLAGVNTTTGLAGVGSGLSGGLSSLGVPSGLSSALPYLAAGGLGLWQASNAAGQNQANVNALSGYGAPYTAAGTALLNQGMSQQLTPLQSNVVGTLNSQGQTLIDSAAPLSSIANTAFANYQAGQLNPGQQQQIDAWTTSAKQQLAQTLSSSGISDSSVLASQNAAIDSQATQLKANLMAQNLQVGDQQYAQWLTSTQAGQQLQAAGAQYAVNSINTMLGQALQLGQTGMQQQSDAIKTGIAQDNVLSNNVGNLFKSLSSAYAVANKPAGAGTGAGSSGTDTSQPFGSPNADRTAFGGGYDTSAVSSQYPQAGVPGGIQTVNPGSLQTPNMADITSGVSMPNFDSSGYNVSAGNNISSSTFNNSFFDPGTTDLPDINFGP